MVYKPFKYSDWLVASTLCGLYMVNIFICKSIMLTHITAISTYTKSELLSEKNENENGKMKNALKDH